MPDTRYNPLFIVRDQLADQESHRDPREELDMLLKCWADDVGNPIGYHEQEFFQ